MTGAISAWMSLGMAGLPGTIRFDRPRSDPDGTIQEERPRAGRRGAGTPFEAALRRQMAAREAVSPLKVVDPGLEAARSRALVRYVPLRQTARRRTLGMAGCS